MSAEEMQDQSRAELEDRISALEEELEDLAHERSLTLGGTGIHIGAKEAERLRAEFEKDEARLTSRLAELRALL